MKEIIKIIKSLEDFCIKWRYSIENEIKEEKYSFLGMLLGRLEANFLENMLTSKGVIKVSNRVQKGGQNFLWRLILWPILKYKSFTKVNINCIYSRNSLLKTIRVRIRPISSVVHLGWVLINKNALYSLLLKW